MLKKNRKEKVRNTLIRARDEKKCNRGVWHERASRAAEVGCIGYDTLSYDTLPLVTALLSFARYRLVLLLLLLLARCMICMFVLP